MKNIKGYSLVVIIMGICGIIFFSLQPDLEDRKHSSEQDIQINSHAFMAIGYDGLEELVGHAEHVVFGSVQDMMDFNDYTGEYVFQIHEQFKGDTESEKIYVYESKGTLVQGESYILFLEKTTGGYFPHPTYTSGFKDSIMHISGEEIHHRSRHLDSDMKLDDVKKHLYALKDHQISNTNRELNRIPIILEHISLEEKIEKADVIALIQPVRFSNQNKYQVVADINIENIYHNSTDIDLYGEPSPLYFLPAATELGTKYIAFLQYDEGVFYTVSLDGSMISHKDTDEWTRALSKVEQDLN